MCTCALYIKVLCRHWILWIVTIHIHAWYYPPLQFKRLLYLKNIGFFLFHSYLMSLCFVAWSQSLVKMTWIKKLQYHLQKARHTSKQHPKKAFTQEKINQSSALLILFAKTYCILEWSTVLKLLTHLAGNVRSGATLCSTCWKRASSVPDIF